MTEVKLGFLYKAASTLAQTDNHSFNLLRSYYLMRCKDVTRGFGLPEKHFSSKVRCPNCCLEWKKGTDVKVRPIKLSKKQRRRIRTRKITKTKKDTVKNRLELLNSNEMEQICTFCKHSTITPIPKAEKIIQTPTTDNKINSVNDKNVKGSKKYIQKTTDKVTVNKVETVEKKKDNVKKPDVNVYSATKEIFSLNSSSNTIINKLKGTPKQIKNNKKKKDKFAGLCQKAVLATAKLKEIKDKQNKLNLFLKPSS